MKRTLQAIILSLLMPCSAWAQNVTTEDTVVATAPGLTSPIEIRAVQLQNYLAEYPKVSPREAIQNLVDFQVLAQVAQQRGLEAHPIVKDAVREALASVYLKTVFEVKWSADTVPETDSRRVYENNRLKFNHPELLNPSHILIGRRPISVDPTFMIFGRFKGTSDSSTPGAGVAVDGSVSETVAIDGGYVDSPEMRQVVTRFYEHLKDKEDAGDLGFKSSIEVANQLLDTAFAKKRNTVAVQVVNLGIHTDKQTIPRMGAEFHKRAFELEKDQITEPFLTPHGWVIIRIKARKEGRMALPEDPALADSAKRIATKIANDLRNKPPKDDAAFREFADSYAEEISAAKLSYVAQNIGLFGLADGPFDRSMDKTFRQKSFAVKTNELSTPFATKFGWHIVRVKSRTPEKRETYVQARDSIRVRILNDVRKRELELLTERLAAKYPALNEARGVARLLRPEPIFAAEQKRFPTPVQK